MNKVYQRIIGSGNGDCMQCVIASLTDSTYEETPPFIEYKSDFLNMIIKFMYNKNYRWDGILHNRSYYTLQVEKNLNQKLTYGGDYSIASLHKHEGVNGLFYASVYSPRFFKPEINEIHGHAVIIDKDYNIVFDPNPEYKGIKSYPLADEIGYNGIYAVDIFNPIKPGEEDEALKKVNTYAPKINDNNLIYYCDDSRHLVCKPYSIENLHKMAKDLNIKDSWFHKNHYDIPKKRIEEITEKCIKTNSKNIVHIIRGRH